MSGLHADEDNFVGHNIRECGEHRTVGPHRAWCFDCGEWCYPASPCSGCEAPILTAERDALAARVEALTAQRDEAVRLLRQAMAEVSHELHTEPTGDAIDAFLRGVDQ